MIGRKYNRLTIISEPYSELQGGKKRRFVDCRCECNKVTKVILNALMSGYTLSCGCAKQKFEDPVKNKILKRTFRNMHDRCENPKNESYHRYGGRGIFVSEEWNDYDVFHEDMAATWQKDLELDRIDNDKGYYKSNCRWATYLVQSRNKSDVVFTEETAQQVRESNLSQNKLAAIFNVNQSTISRIKNNLRWK